MKINKTHKVLIVRFSSIGDIVLTTPIIRCLKQQTGATIHFICKSTYRIIVEANPYLDKVYSFVSSMEECALEMANEKYDYIIDLHNNLRSFGLKRFLGIPRFTFYKANIPKWLMVNFKINRLPKEHIVDRYFQAVAATNIQNDKQGLDYFIPKDARMSIADWCPAFREDKHPQKYIVFAIGAAHATKRLPKEKIIEIIQDIELPVILIGGENDQKAGIDIRKTIGLGKVYNLSGLLSIHHSAYLIQQAQLLITHDTGMMHIGAAFQQKIISIWGNTIPEFGMYPYYKKGVQNNRMVQNTDLSCRPCSKIGHQKCPKGHFKCMNDLDTKQIAQIANDFVLKTPKAT